MDLVCVRSVLITSVTTPSWLADANICQSERTGRNLSTSAVISPLVRPTFLSIAYTYSSIFTSKPGLIARSCIIHVTGDLTRGVRDTAYDVH